MASVRSFPMGRVAFLVTGNIHKFRETCQVLAEYGVATAMLKAKAIEIQSDNVEDIARTSAVDAVEKCGLPIIVEDAGLFVKALRGFPGPYSSYVYRTIGPRGILRLMENVEERDAHFYSVVAFHSLEEETPRCFRGNAEGRISLEERGSFGFGFDPIFVLSGGDKTFAEMTTQEKNRFSHRAQALRKFAEWYTSLR